MAESKQTTQSDHQKVVQNLYSLADAMGCSLYQSAKYADEWLGCKPRQVQVGPWSLSLSNSGWTDQVDNEGCSVFLKIKGDLWAYLISEKGKLQLVLFDGKALGLTRDNAATWGARNIQQTLVDIEKHSVAWFTHLTKEGWKPVQKEVF